MSDDYNQRSYRSNDTVARAPSVKPVTPSGAAPEGPPAHASDPLAELARLIGQTDPFSEYGRAQAKAAAGPAPVQSDWTPPGNYEAPAEPPAAETKFYGTPPFGRQAFGSAQLPDNGEIYRIDDKDTDFAPTQSGYVDDAYDPNGGAARRADEDYYDDAPPRRLGVLVIAAVFALAVVGTAGAFGYRALFGGSGASLPPPVIKADTAPTKVVPPSSKDAANKSITERINDRAPSEKLVSREEKPVEIKDIASLASASDNGLPGPVNAAPPPPQGSGIVGDPKKVRTIVIRPDQSGSGDSAPPPPAAAPPPPVRAADPTPAPARQPPQRVVVAAPPADAEPVVRPGPARVVPIVRQPPPPVANAPLSLNPDAEEPARPAARPARTAATATASVAPAPAAGSGNYTVQVSSQRSEADAEAAFRSLQGKFPSQLGNRQPVIRRVDLGDKGIYYRAMVGPFGSGSEASDLCASLKSAGGSCLIQKN
jgi:hypothetical protein